MIWRAGPGEAFTWAMPLPDNPTTNEIVIESVTPDGVEGLEVLGVMASEDGCVISTISVGFPPADVSVRDVRGATLRGPSEPCALQSLVGVQRIASPLGFINGLRIRYRHAGSAYEVVLPWSLEVKDPGT